MRITTTLFLILFTIPLGWFVMRDAALPPDPALKLKGRLFSFKRSSVTSIEISGKDHAILIERKGPDWWLAAPVNDRANPQLVELLVETLLRLENIETLKPSDLGADGMKHAGLNGTSVKVLVRAGSETLLNCRVGGHTALEDSIYIALPDPKNHSEVHAAKLPFQAELRSSAKESLKLDFVAMVQMPADSWRDPAILRLKADSVRKLSFSAGTGVMELKRAAGQPWELTRPLQTRASDERVNAVLTALLHLPAKEAPKVAKPDTTTPGAVLPSMKVSIEAEGAPGPVNLVLQPGANPDADIPATVSDRPFTFLVPAKSSTIWKLQPNDLRDPHLTHFDPAKVTAIRIRSAARPEVILNKEGGSWMLTRFSKPEPADQERVQRMLSELSVAQVREFAADAANNLEPFGLTQPFEEVEWTAEGRTTVLKFGMNAESRIFCMSGDEPFIYRVNPSLMSALPADGVKWQGLAVVNISTLTVHQIIISEGTAPTVTLVYEPTTGAWGGEVAGQDIGPLIVREKAEALLNKLANFTADAWVTDRTEGYAALKNPALTVRLIITDPTKPDAPLGARTLTFAPASAGATSAFYGRVDQDPDLFLISRDLYREITVPVVR